MTKQSLTDAGVGRALFTTRVRLSIQAGWMCVTFGALPGLLVPMAIWLALVSPFDLDLVRFGVVARLVDAQMPHHWRFREDGVHRAALTVVMPDGEHTDLLTASQAQTVLTEPYRRATVVLGMFAVGAVATAVLGYVLTLMMLRRLGSGSQQNQRLRGAELVVSPKELARRVRRDGGGAYSLAEVALPESAPMTGILVEGAQGSGKSLAVHDLMGQVFARQRKCVIFDQSGEYFRAYFRPGKDVYFNPSLVGSVPWSIFSELRKKYDADTMAQAFLPPKGGVSSGPNAFFEDAARAVFSAGLLRLAEAGAVNTRDIAKVVLEMPADQMDFLIKNTVASSAIAGDSKSQRQGVLSSLAIYLSGLAAVQPGRWSIRHFLESDDDSRLFIVGTEDTKAMFAPLYRLLLATAFSAIASKQAAVHEDRYWFFLDEINELGDCGIDRTLATLRKFGVCVVAGIQAESQLVSSVGQERAATISNCFNTMLVLRANEAGAQERLAKRLGKLEMDTVTRNQALAVAEWRDGAGLNKSEHEKWLVMPSEIGSLETCTGWLKLVGAYPAAKVDYRHWLRPGPTGRVYAFKPVEDLPPEDPDFRIVAVTSEDALESIQGAWQADQERRKAEEAVRATSEAVDRARRGSARTERPSVPPASTTPPALPSTAAAAGGGLHMLRRESSEVGPTPAEVPDGGGDVRPNPAASTDQDLTGDQQQAQGDGPHGRNEGPALDGWDWGIGR